MAAQMTSAKLDGPFRLMVDEIGRAASNGQCGVYALGSIRSDGLFAISFVGASYDGLYDELRNRIGTAPYFKIRQMPDPEKAFLQLCEMFHRFHPSGNFFHPERPKNSRLRCPLCEPRFPHSGPTARRR